MSKLSVAGFLFGGILLGAILTFIVFTVIIQIKLGDAKECNINDADVICSNKNENFNGITLGLASGLNQVF